jgi:hypothetical protein
MGRRRGIAAILTAAAVCLLLAATGAYGAYAILDEHQFADRAASTLGSDEVREEVAARITSRVVDATPRLAGREDAVKAAAMAEVTADPRFAPAFRDAAVLTHRALFADANADTSLRVSGSGAALRRELGRLPGWQSLPHIEDPWLLAFADGGAERRLRAVAPTARRLTIPLTIAFALAGAALFALGIARAATRRRGIWAAGMTVAMAGGLLAAGVTGASDLVLNQFDTGFGHAVVSQVWDAYLADLRLWALALGAAGLVVAAASGGPRLSWRAVLATPGSGSGRFVRASSLLAAAAVAVALPELLLHLALMTVAAVFVYVAAGELVRAGQ